MKEKQSLGAPIFLIILGLLMTFIASMNNEYISLPDFYKGALIGLAIGIEIIAIVQLMKIQQNRK